MAKLDWEKINEARQGYIDKRNQENAEIGLENGLTEEQIDAIEKICGLRHDIHSEDCNTIFTQNDNVSRYFGEICELVSENDLPSLEYDADSDKFIELFITDLDWDYVVSKEEKEKYYEKGKELLRKQEENRVNGITNYFEFDSPETAGHYLFMSDAVEQISTAKEELNTMLEHWLRDIDNKYGTHYEPMGGQRI